MSSRRRHEHETHRRHACHLILQVQYFSTLYAFSRAAALVCSRTNTSPRARRSDRARRSLSSKYSFRYFGLGPTTWFERLAKIVEGRKRKSEYHWLFPLLILLEDILVWVCYEREHGAFLLEQLEVNRVESLQSICQSIFTCPWMCFWKYNWFFKWRHYYFNVFFISIQFSYYILIQFYWVINEILLQHYNSTYSNYKLISFGSKLQSAVVLSSADAEYIALSLVTRILLWMLNIIESIPGQFVQRPILVREDNQPCINLASNHTAF